MGASQLIVTLLVFVGSVLLVSAQVNHDFTPYVTITQHSSVTVIAQQPDGKFLVGGAFDSANGYERQNIVRFHPDGTVDDTFRPVGSGFVYSIAVQSDGKILVAGGYEAIINGITRDNLVRLNADGSGDETFLTGTGSPSTVNRVVVQPDGRIVICGNFSSFNGVARDRVARLHPDGSLDMTLSLVHGGLINALAATGEGKIFVGGEFGLMNGVPAKNLARINSDGTVDPTVSVRADFAINALRIQTDGKLLVGQRFTPTIGGEPRGLAFRVNADGSLDSTFTAGINDNFNPETYSLDVQPDGKILVGGRFGNTSGPTRGLYRLLSDGRIDPSFVPLHDCLVYSILARSNGKILVGGNRSWEITYRNLFFQLQSTGEREESFRASVGFATHVNAVETTPDGKIYVAGEFVEANGRERKRIARLKSNGELDETFVTEGTNGTVYDLAVQADGKVILVGEFGLIKRLNADGSDDPTFTPCCGADGTINDVAVQADGKILIGGVFNQYTGHSRRGLARLNSDGSLDLGFTIGDTGFQNAVVVIVPLPDGKTLVGGYFAQLNNVQVGCIVRLNADGSRDVGFNPGGSGAGSPGTQFRLISAIVPQSDGRVLIGGRFFSFNGIPRQSLARLNEDGSLDTSYSLSTDTVFEMRMDRNGKILLGGRLPVFGGIIKGNLARLNNDGSLDESFDAGFNTNADVYSISLFRNGDAFVIGGGFRRFDGVAHQGLAMIGVPSHSVTFDFDGDSKTDIGIYRPNGGSGSEWWLQRSSNGSGFATQFGAPTDKIAAADYTGDGKTDVAFWRPSTGFWFVLRSEDQTFYAFPFGTNGDVPVPADYDADGKADVGVFRPSSSTWFIQRSSDNGTTIQAFGIAGDVPANADYDGDGKSDIAIYRPSLGQWWLLRSSAGAIAYQFGSPTDKTVQGDYTGDGKADVAFWRPATGEWYVLRSEDSSFFAFPFGIATDAPVPGDYDGDGRNDAGVFRSSSNTWYIQRSTAGTLIQQFGTTGDVPLPSAYVR